MPKSKFNPRRSGDENFRNTRSGNRLQIILGLIAGISTISAAILGAILSRNSDSGAGSSEQASAVSSSASPSLSAPAMALINQTAIPCQPSKPPVPNIGDVAISSPLSGDTLSRHGTVRGTAKISGSDQLYFFVYAPGACAYYFQPGAPVNVEPDDSWQVSLYLDGSNPGDKVDLYAAVVGPEAQAILGEIVHYFDVKHESAYVLQLPNGTRTAHINVELS